MKLKIGEHEIEFKTNPILGEDWMIATQEGQESFYIVRLSDMAVFEIEKPKFSFRPATESIDSSDDKLRIEVIGDLGKIYSPTILWREPEK